MRNGCGTLATIVAAAVAVLGTTAPAFALNAKATLADGVVSISGSQAAKSASISWEGVAATTSNKGGNFSFVSQSAGT